MYKTYTSSSILVLWQYNTYINEYNLGNLPTIQLFLKKLNELGWIVFGHLPQVQIFIKANSNIHKQR